MPLYITILALTFFPLASGNLIVYYSSNNTCNNTIDPVSANTTNLSNFSTHIHGGMMGANSILPARYSTIGSAQHFIFPASSLVFISASNVNGDGSFNIDIHNKFIIFIGIPPFIADQQTSTTAGNVVLAKLAQRNGALGILVATVEKVSENSIWNTFEVILRSSIQLCENCGKTGNI